VFNIQETSLCLAS